MRNDDIGRATRSLLRGEVRRYDAILQVDIEGVAGADETTLGVAKEVITETMKAKNGMTTRTSTLGILNFE